jgi:hypothetical protein
MGFEEALFDCALREVRRTRRLPTRLKERAASFVTLERDTAISTEISSQFVRYFPTVAAALTEGEQESARLLGRSAVASLSDRHLVSDLLDATAAHKPDLFATTSADMTIKPPSPMN